jgi:CRISPR-associated protein (TIGR02584 family)
LTVQRKITIDEIYILTTVRGRNVILGKDKAAGTPKSKLKDEIVNLSKKYKIKIPLFEENSDHIIVAKEESIELSDIRTDRQNKLFPNKACDFIRQKSSDPENILYCSISGGRKTMSVHMAFALNLFGREKDKLLHVLTSEENEFKGFYPVNKKEDKQLELSEIPFIRLRSLISRDGKDDAFFNLKYSQLVELTQKQLKSVSDERKLILLINEKTIKYGSEKIKLEPIEFVLYYMFIEAALENQSKYKINFIISKEFAGKVEAFIKENYSYYYFNEEAKKTWWKNGFSAENIRTRRTKINSKIQSLIKEPDLTEEFQIKSIKNYGETAYYIPAAKSKIKISF